MSSASAKVLSLTKKSHAAFGTFVAGAGVVAAASGANAEVIGLQIYDINKTAKNGSFKFDLNKDGRMDFAVTAKETFPGKGFALIKGLGGKVKMKNLLNGPKMKPILNKGGQGKVALNPWQPEGQNFVQRLDAPGQVDATTGEFNTKGTFYDDNGLMGDVFRVALVDAEIEPITNNGPFAKPGDVGYIGLSLTFNPRVLKCSPEFLEEEICSPIFDDREQLQLNALEAEGEMLIEGPITVTHYGWAEVVRGSLTVNRIGFQTIPGAAAPLPPVDVSEPATLPLLALGAAGIAALRRRKSVAA